MHAIVRGAKQAVSGRFDALLYFCFRVVSRGLDQEVARRAVKRGEGSHQWIIPEEAVVAEAVANLIVPSDSDTPGAEDVCVLGPSTIDSLDQIIRNSPWRQSLYGRGLLSFDVWAQKQRGCLFAKLPEEEQIHLLKTSQQVYEEWTAPASLIKKAWRRLKIAVQKNGVPFSAAQLYPHIRSDCLQIFYTSKVSWVWLDYDGPPMEQGYPDLAARR
jgi:Gluconate 2-dehydrogenase subunit 3